MAQEIEEDVETTGNQEFNWLQDSKAYQVSLCNVVLMILITIMLSSS